MTKSEKEETAPRRPLPGEPDMPAAISRMIRVNQAGEYGAARIYDGQLAVLGDKHPMTPEISRMRAQEQDHLDVFNEMISKRGVRPTVLQPLWDLAGYSLGAATALLGGKAAMACTAAVEEVIEHHYSEQRETLRSWEVEAELEGTLEEFEADEIEHRDTALAAGAELTPGYRLLSESVKAGCKAAIWLSKRL